MQLHKRETLKAIEIGMTQKADVLGIPFIIARPIPQPLFVVMVRVIRTIVPNMSRF